MAIIQRAAAAKILRALLSAGIALGCCGTASAGEIAYTCTVMHVYDLESSGEIRISNAFNFLKQTQFSVSRITGEIIGETLTTVLAKSTEVINTGSNEYAFKTVSYFSGQVQLLEVQEFMIGVIKPFIALSMGGAGVVTGVCK